MDFDPAKPYNDLPPLPPRVEFESKSVLRKVVTARAALAELKGISETIPDPEILINSILMQEAKDSSEIENIVTTHDNLYKAAVLNDDRSEPETKEVIRYRQAVWNGFGMLKERHFINTNTAVKIYQILNVLFLVQEQLLHLPILYHSSFIISNKQEYYRLLRAVTSENKWEAWVIYMLGSIEQTSLQTIEKINLIRELMNQTFERVKTDLPRLRQSKEIVEILFMYPYCKIDHLVERKIAVRQSASKYLKELEAIGVLKSETIWKQTVYRNVVLWNALTGMSR